MTSTRVNLFSASCLQTSEPKAPTPTTAIDGPCNNSADMDIMRIAFGLSTRSDCKAIVLINNKAVEIQATLCQNSLFDNTP
jgi:hypothetical protein